MLQTHIAYDVMRNEKEPKNESKSDLNFLKTRITYMFKNI